MSANDIQDPIARAVLSQVALTPPQFHAFARNLHHAKALGVTITPDVALDIARAIAGNQTPPSGDTRDLWPDPIPPETPSRHRPVVYYVLFGDRVKIGTTRNLRQRLLEVPHDQVLALEPGDATLERQRHAKFRAFRLHREWFAYVHPLSTFIHDLPTIDSPLAKYLSR